MALARVIDGCLPYSKSIHGTNGGEMFKRRQPMLSNGYLQRCACSGAAGSKTTRELSLSLSHRSACSIWLAIDNVGALVVHRLCALGARS